MSISAGGRKSNFSWAERHTSFLFFAMKINILIFLMMTKLFRSSSEHFLHRLHHYKFVWWLGVEQIWRQTVADYFHILYISVIGSHTSCCRLQCSAAHRPQIVSGNIHGEKHKLTPLDYRIKARGDFSYENDPRSFFRYLVKIHLDCIFVLFGSKGNVFLFFVRLL